MALQIATYVAAVSVLGSLVSRWAAVPALVIAFVGVLTVFAGYIQTEQPITWDQTTAMVAYGLTMITALMVLVEIKGER